MIILYHLKNSRSQRVIWLLEELGCEYQVVEQSRIDSSFKFPEHIKPLKFPTVSINHEDGVIFMSETSAICEFLCTITHKLLPLNGTFSSTANNIFWKNYADATLMQTLVLKQVFKQIVSNTPFLFKPITLALKSAFFKMYLNGTLAQQLSRVDAHLKDHKWMCGVDFSYVDILMWFPLLAGMTGIKPNTYANIQRYFGDLNQRSAFQNAQKIGDWEQDLFDQYWS
jgi:glutathione S-transferase